MPFLIALILLAAFIANVTIGAIGDAPLVGIVAELLLLLGASIAFVVGILRCEARDKREKT